MLKIEIKNIMKYALLCMGLVFSIQCMEEREDGSKADSNMTMQSPLEIEIQQAIADAKETGCFKNLLKLKSREDIIGTHYEQVLEQVIAEFMRRLYCEPIPSLKKICLQKLAVCFGKLVKEKKFEQIGNTLQQLPEDLRELLNQITQVNFLANGKKLPESCLDFAINFSTNWEIISLLIPHININDKQLLCKIISAGNMFLLQQIILRGVKPFTTAWNFLNFFEMGTHDYLKSIIYGNRKNNKLFPFLISAGLPINRFKIKDKPYGSLLHFFAFHGNQRDLNILYDLSKIGSVFDLKQPDQEGLTPLERTIIAGRNPQIICWFIDEAGKQGIVIKELLQHLINENHSASRVTGLHAALRGTIFSFIRFKKIDKDSIRCIKKFLEWEPSVKTNEYKGKTFLTHIMQDADLSQNKELIALFK